MRELGMGCGFGGEVFERVLLLGCGGRVDSGVIRRAELGSKLLVMCARIFAGICGDFCREQAEDKSVFIRAPDSAVAPKETGSGAFLAAKATGAVKQSGREPFEADWHFPKLATEACDDSIDETTADERCANDCVWRPLHAVGQKIANSDR